MTESTKHKDRLIAELLDNFVDRLIVYHAIRAEPVEAAFRSVPRHLFVDRYYQKDRLVNIDPQHPTRGQLKKIYNNDALVSHRYRKIPTSSTSQPSLVAQMLEELQLEPGMKVLEIGAGTGWNAALMGYIVGPEGHIYSIDIQSDVAQRAENHVQQLGMQNVEIITGDGGYGYGKRAPYDRIITTVNCPEISPHWMAQLTEGGALLITLRDMEGSSWCLLIRLWKRKDHLKGEVVSLPGFMTLQGKYGAEVVQPSIEEQLKVITDGRRPRAKPTPWGRLGFPENFWKWRLIDVVFFAHLEGMSIKRIGEQYALGHKGWESACVTNDEHIDLYGDGDAYQALEEITRKWIRLGAPGRHSYCVEVWPLHIPKRKPKNGWLVQRQYTQLIFRLKLRDEWPW